LATGLVVALLVTESWPVVAPVTVGSKVNDTASVWPGLSVAGRVTGESEKPLPVTAMALTVTAAVPLEVNVTLCVVELFTTTAPKEMLVALRVSAGVAAFSCSASVCELLPLVAVREAACAVVTEAIFAAKDALDAVAGTVTELGTVTALLLLASATLTPPVGADPDRLTVQESASAPVMEVLLQYTALTVGATAVPVPVKLTVAAGALLEMVNCPVEELAVAGSNWTVSTAAWPGVRVAGKLPPETENPVPVIASELIVTDAVPLEVTVTDFVTAVPTATLPNDNVVAFKVNAGVEAFS
jgi:hypothetical protein